MISTVKNVENTEHMILVVKAPPYKGENSFAALSNLFANLDEGVVPIVIYIFNGVWNLLPKQFSEKLSNFPNIEDIYKSVISEASFYAYKDSLERRGLIGKKLLPGVKVLDMKALIKIFREFGDNILFF